jgi:hypothetical protein
LGPCGGKSSEILFEIRRVGRAIRVAAIDACTNTEVVVIGPAGCAEEALKRLALRKLARAVDRGRRPPATTNIT